MHHNRIPIQLRMTNRGLYTIFQITCESGLQEKGKVKINEMHVLVISENDQCQIDQMKMKINEIDVLVTSESDRQQID